MQRDIQSASPTAFRSVWTGPLTTQGCPNYGPQATSSLRLFHLGHPNQASNASLTPCITNMVPYIPQSLKESSGGWEIGLDQEKAEQARWGGEEGSREAKRLKRQRGPVQNESLLGWEVAERRGSCCKRVSVSQCGSWTKNLNPSAPLDMIPNSQSQMEPPFLANGWLLRTAAQSEKNEALLVQFQITPLAPGGIMLCVYCTLPFFISRLIQWVCILTMKLQDRPGLLLAT